MKTSSDLRPLLDLIKKNKYKVVPSGKHHKVLDPKGRVVTDANGPLIISSTPGDHRARDMHVKRLRDAGVLKPDQDPWKPQKEKDPDAKGKKKDPLAGDPEAKARREAAKVAAIKAKSAANAERTRKVRARLEPIVTKLGGWDKFGLTSNLGLVYFHLMKTMNQVDGPATAASAAGTIQRLKRGETLSEKTIPLVEIMLNDLEKKGDPVARFMELQREAKGIIPPAPGPAPFPRAADAAPGAGDAGDAPTDPEAGAGTARPVTLVPRRHPAAMTVPELAIEAAVRMARDPEADIEKVIALAQKLAFIELQHDEGGS
jgi:hypothetical protein